MPLIPRTMSTQHPDNVMSPFFPRELLRPLDRVTGGAEPNAAHKTLTDSIAKIVHEQSAHDIRMPVFQAARIRGFLG